MANFDVLVNRLKDINEKLDAHVAFAFVEKGKALASSGSYDEQSGRLADGSFVAASQFVEVFGYRSVVSLFAVVLRVVVSLRKSKEPLPASLRESAKLLSKVLGDL